MNSDTLGHRFGAGSISGHATGTVTLGDKFGAQTRAAIDGMNTAKAAWFDECPTMAPSHWYTGSAPLQIGAVTDLLYRPNDRITLADIERAKGSLGGYQIKIDNGAIKGVSLKSPEPAQVGGTHYAKLAIDPFKYAMANKLDALQFSVIKYVTRFREKGGIEDLRKAQSCIARLIAHEEAAK